MPVYLRYTMGTTKKDTATRGGHNPRGMYVFLHVPFPHMRELRRVKMPKHKKYTALKS